MVGTYNILGRVEENIKEFIAHPKDTASSIGRHLLDEVLGTNYSDHRPHATKQAPGGSGASSIEDLGFPRLEPVKADVTQARSKPGRDIPTSLMVDGEQRHYLLHLPANYKDDPRHPVPLVVVLHGWGQNGERIRDISKMSEKADKEGFIVAYPDAQTVYGSQDLRAWGTGNGLRPDSEPNDVGFVRDLIADIKRQRAIDPDKVYVAGFSNGSMLGYKVAAELSDVVAAFADVSGAPSGFEQRPDSSVSLLAIHGTGDLVVPIRGRNTGTVLESIGVPRFESLERSLAAWRERDGVNTPPRTVQLDGVTAISSTNRTTGAEVAAFILDGGHHRWPGSDDARAAYPNSVEARFPATDLIWDFFKRHPKSNKPSSPLSPPNALTA